MKANLNNISLRAQDLIKNPKFFNKSTSSDFLVTIDDHDTILTVSHGKNPDNIEFVLAEIMAKFSENKKITEVWKINFREIESFLRDENHLPAFVGDTQEIESLLRKIKASLIAFAVRAKLKKQHEWIVSKRKNWNHLSLTSKNEWAKILIDTLGWELVLCEESTLTATKTPFEVDEDTLSLLINMIVGEEENVSPMKVVAV